MNRINNYVLNGAIALLSTAGLVACSSDDVTDAPVNPTYDGKSVKTQFAINIATPSNSQTRMSAANTQNEGNYLNMAHVRLLTYTLETSMNASSVPGTVLKLAEPTDVKYDNGTLNSSHIYSDVNIPVGTNNFLFYWCFCGRYTCLPNSYSNCPMLRRASSLPEAAARRKRRRASCLLPVM